MRTFGIALEKPNAEVERRINEAYPEPDNYRLSDTFYLVMRDTLADTVAKTVGLYGKERVKGASGVVVRITRTHAGYANAALWDWFERVEEHT